MELGSRYRPGRTIRRRLVGRYAANAFDLVVPVALGSTLTTVLLSKTVALAQGVPAFAVLIVLHMR